MILAGRECDKRGPGYRSPASPAAAPSFSKAEKTRNDTKTSGVMARVLGISLLAFNAYLVQGFL